MRTSGIRKSILSGTAARLWRGLALASALGAALATGALPPAVPRNTPAPTPRQQARMTERMLEQLGGGPTQAPRPRPAAARVPLTSSTQARTAPVKPRTAPAKARVTSATLIIRRAAPGKKTALKAANRATTRGLGSMPRVPALPADDILTTGELARMLAHRGRAATAAPAMPAIPAVNPAWIGLASQPITPAAAAVPLAPAASLGPTTGTVHINRAEVAELRAKLHIDGARARNIVEFRTLYGRFKRPEDLREVNGLDDEMIRQWDELDQLIFD